MDGMAYMMFLLIVLSAAGAAAVALAYLARHPGARQR